ncbi:MAG: phytoene desaturase [Myxococcales bacterium]|nr:phytoene desaturase [Myxococcales bacterium]
MPTPAPQLIVIGAGLGGLAAAIRLLCRGYAVTVLEATDRIGGRASVFERDGFVFDAGPTVVTAPYLFDELFAVAGRRFADHVQMRRVDPFYRVDFDDGSRFDYVGDEDRIVRQIADFSPRDVAGYHKLVAHSKEIFAIGYEQLAHVPFDRLTDMLRVVPAMLRLHNHKSVYALVSEYIRDERLRQVFTFQPLLVGGNPFRTSSIYLLIHWLERKWGGALAAGRHRQHRAGDGPVGRRSGRAGGVQRQCRRDRSAPRSRRRCAHRGRAASCVHRGSGQRGSVAGVPPVGCAATPPQVDQPQDRWRRAVDVAFCRLFWHQQALSGGQTPHNCAWAALP